MRKSTKNALLIALFSQKASKEDEHVFYLSAVICTSLLIIGGALESTFLFRTGLGLILLVPMLLGSFRKFIASRGTSRQTAWTIHFFSGAAMGILFLIGLSASIGGLVTFSFIGLLAVIIIEGIMKKIRVRETGMAYTTKKDFWGNATYYDEDGNLIGKEETTWLGDRVIKDQYGNRIGRPETDIYGRETITLEEDSFFFGKKTKTILKDGELEDWEMCENCGDYNNGEDDLYCDDCLHDH